MERVTQSVSFNIGPGNWYHIPETDVEILIHNGPMVVMSVRKRLPVPTAATKVKQALPKLPDDGKEENK